VGKDQVELMEVLAQRIPPPVMIAYRNPGTPMIVFR
jgi:hypothetical protein